MLLRNRTSSEMPSLSYTVISSMLDPQSTRRSRAVRQDRLKLAGVALMGPFAEAQMLMRDLQHLAV